MLDVIDPYNLKRVLERVNELRDLAAVSADVSFLRHARRATLPLPAIDRPQVVDGEVFPAFRARPVAGLRDRRVAIITSGGSGGCVALVGVARAFEEAGIRPALISCCSGSVIWGAMWAAGLSAQEMADFSLSWQPERYLDIQWARLPRFLLSALRDFTGLAKGEAIERLFDGQAWSRPVGKLETSLSTIVYNMDLGEVEYFGSANTPELTVGELVRIGIALPVFIEAVPVQGHLYVDGGIIELFPAEPVIADPSIDHAFGVNFMLPPHFQPQNVTGWHTHRLGILQASRQLQQGYQLELARRSQRQLGDRLTLIDPIDYTLLRGVSFYDLFIDRRKWPELIRQGYRAARRTLEAFTSTDGSVTSSVTIARTSLDAIVRFLEGERIDYELVEHEAVMSAADEARVVDRPQEQVAKTVVLHDGDEFVIAAIPASERLDLHKLRVLLGASRELRLATEDEIAREFPLHEVGAIPPFGPMVPTAEVIDRALLEQQQILCAAGDHRHSVVVDPLDIVRIADARTADICQD